MNTKKLKLNPVSYSILFFSILFMLLSSCGPTPAESTFAKIDKLYELELTKADYVVLKTAAGPSAQAGIVFQFSYDKTKTMRLSMIGYASRPGHQFQDVANPPVSKDLKAVAESALVLPDRIVLGDQQVPIGAIDALITSVGNPADYILTFKPELNGINIRYKICVKGFACPAPAAFTQPSPPANAN